MTDKTQPEALRLAEQYDYGDPVAHSNAWKAAVCTEPCSQHARIAELKARVQELGAMARENRSRRIVELEAQLEALRAALSASPTPPAEQQAAPKAAPGVGNSGFDHKTAADFLSGKTVSDEDVRKFVQASRWAHDEKAALSAMLLSVRGVLASREAEIALLKKALMEAEAAPQQEAQEPVGWTTSITWRPNTRLQSEQVIKITREAQPKYGYTTPIYTAPQPAPAPMSEDVVKDAARYRWLRATTNFATNSQGERIDVRNQPEKWDAAIDAALAAQGDTP